MVGKMKFLTGLGIGYVLGARAGRERYRQIAAKARGVWQDPRVQKQAGNAQSLIKEKAGDVGSTVAHTVAEKVKDTVGGSSGGGSGSHRSAGENQPTSDQPPFGDPTPGTGS